MRKGLVAAVILLALAVPALAATLAGVTFPDSVTVGDRTLVLNGMGVRSKWMVKVYVGGLYLERKSTDAAAVIQADASKRIVLQFVRDVSRDQMTEAFDESLQANGGGKAATLKNEIAQFLDALEPMKSGEQLVVTYAAGGTTVSVRGKDKVRIPGLPFGQLVFAMWLGPKPPNGALKDGLLGK